MTSSVFVYGTLKRGHCRAHFWPCPARRTEVGWVRGSLFGRDDYPAMRPGQDRVLGEWREFEPHLIPSVLEVLDRVEGTNVAGQDDLYHRLVVDVWSLAGDRLGEAWIYHYATDPLTDGFELIEPTDQQWVQWP